MSILAVDFQNAHKRFARHGHAAHLTHTFFAFLLFFQKFFLSCDVAAVALCKDVFPDGFDGFPCDDFAAYARLTGISNC